MTPTACTSWLRELATHPTDHPLLAAYTFLTHLSQTPAHPDAPHRSQTPAHPDAPHLSQTPAHPDAPRPSQTPAHPDAPHLSQTPGTGAHPPIRFTHTTDLALPLGELQAVTRDPADPTRHLVTTAIAGPLGHDTPLPLSLADELDHPLAHALLDSFHHRRTLLLCQGLFAADLAATLDGRDLWSRRIAGLTGLTGLADLPGLADHDPLAALRLAPIFAAGDRSPRALNLALRRLLPGLGPRVQLRVEPLPGRLIPLAADQHTRLGGPVARLGDTAALGHAVCLPGSAARLVLGPLASSARAGLAPGQPAHALLHALLAAFIPEPLALELQLELDDLSLPPARLGQRALGRDLWLSPAARPGAPIRVPLPLTPARPPCPSPACRSASTTAAAA